MPTKNPTIKRKKNGPIKTGGKGPIKRRGFTTRQVHLASEIKRINERIAQLERRGFTGTPAYSKIVSAKYGKENIITEKVAGKKTPTAPLGTKGGGLKIRTDVKNMSESELQAVEQLIKDFTATPSTVRELTKQKKDFAEYFNKYEKPADAEDIKPEKVTDEMLKDYIQDIEDITADAIAKAFYIDTEGFSLMYERSQAGEKYQDLKQEVIEKLLYIKRTQGFNADHNPYDEQIINAFYTEE